MQSVLRRVLRRVLLGVALLALAACGGGDGDGNPPSGVSSPAVASQGTASLTLRWNANTEPDLAGYRIYGAKSSGAYGAPVATVPASATSFVATGLEPGVTYFFVISAFDTAGNESPRSAEVSAVASL
jgi:hypothetical protein